MKTPELVTAFLQHSKRIGNSPKTVDCQENALGVFQDYAGFKSEITPELVTGYSQWLINRGVKGSTAGKYLSVLAGCLKFAFDWQIMPRFEVAIRNPLMVEDSERMPITQDDYHKLLAAAQGKPKWSYAIRIGWATGLRLGDAATLQRDALNVDACSIVTVPAKTARRKK